MKTSISSLWITSSIMSCFTQFITNPASSNIVINSLSSGVRYASERSKKQSLLGFISPFRHSINWEAIEGMNTISLAVMISILAWLSNKLARCEGLVQSRGSALTAVLFFKFCSTFWLRSMLRSGSLSWSSKSVRMMDFRRYGRKLSPTKPVPVPRSTRVLFSNFGRYYPSNRKGASLAVLRIKASSTRAASQMIPPVWD